MAESKVTPIKSLSDPSESGTYFRILCMTGKNQGMAWLLNGYRIIMGRGEDVDIQVLDKRSSREHAELVKHEDGYVITDLKSQNGVTINDFKIDQHKMVDGDKIVIGQTVFKFNKIVVEKKITLVEAEGTPEEYEGDEEYENDKNSERDSASTDAPAKKKRFLIYGSALIALVFFLLEDEGERNPASTKKAQESVVDNALDDLIKKQAREKSKEEKARLEEYIHRGQREFREGNYFRAIEEFNMALILSPNDGHAGFYLNKTKQALDRHIKLISDKGAREYGQLKYRGAVKSYCEIVKLLLRYPEDERYKEAKSQIELIEKKLGYEEGEYRCIKEEIR